MMPVRIIYTTLLVSTFLIAGCNQVTLSNNDSGQTEAELTPSEQANLLEPNAISAEDSAVAYQSEFDNFEILLPERLFPVQLNYDQNTNFGVTRVKSVSFHSGIAKFVIEIVDTPDAYQRTDIQRIQIKIDQLINDPYRTVGSVEDISTDIVSGAIIKSERMETSETYGIFVDGQREYHISSESFQPINLDRVLSQTEQLVRSFKLATANARYYQDYDSRKVDALITSRLYPAYADTAISNLDTIASEVIEKCYALRSPTPAELILIVDDNGQIENALSSPRSEFGRCMELAYISLFIDSPPISELHLLVTRHL